MKRRTTEELRKAEKEPSLSSALLRDSAFLRFLIALLSIPMLGAGLRVSPC
jgi:hypothetical protein